MLTVDMPRSRSARAEAAYVQTHAYKPLTTMATKPSRTAAAVAVVTW